MKTNTIYKGDVLEVMSTFPAKSVNCIITSPPYYKQRNYNWSGQWGLEKTPSEFINKLVLFMSESKRVLTDDGCIFINLADSYSKNKKGLLLIPERFKIRCTDELRLIMENDIIWAKENAMPESVLKRFSRKHEYIFFFVKKWNHYFDLESIRIEQKEVSIQRLCHRTGENNKYWKNTDKTIVGGAHSLSKPRLKRDYNTIDRGKIKGKNPGDVSDFWNVNIKAAKSDHYATFNQKLIEMPILSGCPENGIILDPFCGEGNTLVRALQLNRQVIGIDGSQKSVDNSRKNIDDLLNQNKLFA